MLAGEFVQGFQEGIGLLERCEMAARKFVVAGSGNCGRQVPRMLQHPKRKTIGIRLPQHAITMALLEQLGEPLMTTSLILPGDDYPLNDPEEIRERLLRQVDLIIDGGPSPTLEPSTVVDLAGDQPQLLRAGAGDPAPFLAA